MRFSLCHFCVAFILSLLAAGEVYALPAPPRPSVISRTYLDKNSTGPTDSKGLFQHVEDYLTAATAGSPSSCTAEEKIRFEAQTARELRDVLFDLRGASIEPPKDLERTACFRSDAEALERYIRALSELALESARDDCDLQAAGHYRAMVDYVWDMLRGLRRFGLDPRVQVPLTGTGADAPPSGATAASDDDLCPYHSGYASMQFGNLGCQELSLPAATPSFRIHREVSIFEWLRRRMDINIVNPTLGLATQFRALRKAIDDLRAATNAYVSSLAIRRPLAPSSGATLTFTPFVAMNAGESGCLGWPSNVGGNVSAKDASLQRGFPFLLTQELRETFAYLRAREGDAWFEYVHSLEEERQAGGSEQFALGSSYLPDLYAVNRVHLGLESFSILTIRDPQEKMEALGDRLHERTRELASFVIPVEKAVWPPETALPPLRSFVRATASFLSRMCINRGCEEPLLRVTELTLRDECFSSFLMDLFFKANPNAATLPVCRAIYHRTK